MPKLLVYKMLILHSPPVLLPRKAQVVAKLASGRSASKFTGILFQHMYTDNEKNSGLYSAMIVLLALFLTIIFYF